MKTETSLSSSNQNFEVVFVNDTKKLQDISNSQD